MKPLQLTKSPKSPKISPNNEIAERMKKYMEEEDEYEAKLKSNENVNKISQLNVKEYNKLISTFPATQELTPKSPKYTQAPHCIACCDECLYKVFLFWNSFAV